jgi:fructose 1,6-bisphosphatase
VNPPSPEAASDPVVSLRLPGGERINFLLTDMRIMAGPLRTPGSILDEVRPYSTNFYVRASWDDVARITNADPDKPVEILAMYSSADRSLFVKEVERPERAQGDEAE